MTNTPNTDFALSVAPMMDWTDRHCRYFHRLLSPNIRLFTEMVTCGALIHGPRERLLSFDSTEHPVALQLGGSSPEDLAYCARLGAEAGYDEINLNCGCPSDRVKNGSFGACLMKEPDRVAQCIRAMQDSAAIPVTVKCRIGVDSHDSSAFLRDFIQKVSNSGCRKFYIHARKAWLQGLNPKQNREIPPLNYNRVYALKQVFPDLEFIINGGLQSVADIRALDGRTDGAMIGRAAYKSPLLLQALEDVFYGTREHTPPDDIVSHMSKYLQREADQGTPVRAVTRHMLGLYQNCPGARLWRQALSSGMDRCGADSPAILDHALDRMREGARGRAA